MRVSWSFRFVAGSVLLVGAALAVFWLVEQPRAREAMEARLRDTLLGHATVLAYALEGQDLAAPEVRERVRRLGAELGVRVTLVAPDGTIVADSAVEDLASMGNYLHRSEVAAALRDGRATARRPPHGVDRETLLAAARIPGGGVARVAWEAGRHEAESARPTAAFWWGAGGVLAAGALAALALGRGLGRRLRELERAAAAVEAGDLEARVAVRGADELSRFGETFHRMTARLRETLARAEKEAARLATILEGMDEGVVAVDDEERISFVNGAARAILRLGPEARLEGVRLYEVLRDPAILGLVKASAEARRPVERELELEGPPRRLVHVHAAPVAGGGPGAILVLRDMSRIRALERMRTDFVSNVSHELRTPLAAISAAAEHLQDTETRADPEAGPRFVDAIVRNASRLEVLLDDILALSRFETHPESIERVTVDFAALVRLACEELRERAKAAGLDLSVAAPPRLAVAGDPGALRRIVDNLVVNALTYTPRGGRVAVTLSMEAGEAVLRVADTGIGIPPGDLDRIFERFYRVDKARSRSAGGTGLGLSIVKHAVGLHGGRVGVESELGKGSTFTVRIPAAAAGERAAS
jgi:two-component system phosphate regulon sensor histidine kinase PhoR